MKSFIGILCLGCFFVHAQVLNSISFTGTRGAIIEHTAKLSHLVEKKPYFLELCLARSTNGSKLWHHENQFPDYGILFNFQNLGNPNRLGNSWALASFFELNLHKPCNTFNLKLRITGGFAYLTKRFDIQKNHKHIALSSHINVYAALRWSLFIKLTPHFLLIPNLQFSHVSNGRFRVPNLGINTIYPNIALQYQIKETEKKAILDSSYRKITKNEIYVWAGYGRNQEYPPGGKSFPNYTVSGTYYWNLKNKHQLGLGLDAYYEPSLNIKTQPTENITHYYFKNGFSTGIKLAYAFNYGRWILPLEYGYYLLSGVNQFPNGMHFHRIGLRYYHKNRLVSSFTLKSHFAVAYHFDIGIGYRFWVHKKLQTFE